MHMIATNLCEWLYVLVEETKHEIIHLGSNKLPKTNVTLHDAKYCQEGHVMGILVSNASPFLFPCTIEYSLICAVILFEMWKKVKSVEVKKKAERARFKEDKAANVFNFSTLLVKLINFSYNILDLFGGNHVNSDHHFSVDCSNAHRGLFGGILVIVLTIISLIMFFVLTNKAIEHPEEYENITIKEIEDGYKNAARFEVNVLELTLYVLTTIVVVVAMLQMRCLKYDRKVKGMFLT